MAFIVLITTTLIVLYFLLNWFVRMDSHTLTKALKIFAIIAGIVLFLALLLTGRGLIGLSIGALMIPFLYKNFSLRPDKMTSHIKNRSTHCAMTVEEAAKILEIHKNASREEIIEAHKKMIQINHPDHGGSTYLSQKINEAKDVLLQNNN